MQIARYQHFSPPASRRIVSDVQYRPTMQTWWQTLADCYARSSGWIEGFYKAHTGLVGLIGVLGTLACAVYARLAISKSDSTPPNGASRQLNPALRLRLLDWVQREEKPPESLDRRNRLEMLKRVQLDWIEGVLKQSLYQVARIDLGLQTNTDAVQQPLRAIVQTPDQRRAIVPVGTSIVQVFDDHASALLILGDPGTGKTTLLLELAEELLSRARREETHPMPVVFNLSSWAARRTPLTQWLVSELNERSDVPKGLAQRWIETEQIIPLLDGLDEVRVEHRQACAEAINNFRRDHGLLPIAVCSRIADYEALGTKLRMRCAVVVQPLSRADLRNYLERVGEPLRGLRTALRRDSPLWEILETPLMLWVATLAYRGVPVESFGADSLKQQRKRIFANFVDAMFRRRSAETRYTPTQTVSFLCWLACALKLNEQTVFYLENLSEAWLPTPSHRWLSRAGLVLAEGVVCALVGSVVGVVLGPWLGHWGLSKLSLILINGLFDGLVFGLILGLCLGLVSALMSAVVFLRPIEAIQISLLTMTSRLRRATRDGLIVASSGGLILGLLGALNNILTGGELKIRAGSLAVYVNAGLREWISIGLSLGLAIGLVTLLSGEAVGTRRSPNQGTHRSIRMAILVGLILGLVSGLVYGLIFGAGHGFFNGLANGVISGLAAGGMFSRDT